MEKEGTDLKNDKIKKQLPNPMYLGQAKTNFPNHRGTGNYLTKKATSTGTHKYRTGTVLSFWVIKFPQDTLKCTTALHRSVPTYNLKYRYNTAMIYE